MCVFFRQNQEEHFPKTNKIMYIYSVQTKINTINCHKNRLPVIKVNSKNFSDSTYMNRIYPKSPKLLVARGSNFVM